MDSEKGKKPVKRAAKKPASKANKPIKIIPRNEQKATVKALEEKEVLFTNFNNILAAVLKDPTLWTKPEFQPLRDFSTTVIEFQKYCGDRSRVPFCYKDYGWNGQ